MMLDVSNLQYEIDRLNIEDLPDIMVVEQASFAYPWPQEAFVAEFSKPYSRFLGVRYGNHVVAVLLYWLVLPEIHISSLAVHPNHRRRHLATWLLQVLFEIGREWGASQIDLEVREHNIFAQQLYESMGFQRVGMRKKYYVDTDEAAYLYSYFYENDKNL